MSKRTRIRNKTEQRHIKKILLNKHGNYCWLCKKKFAIDNLTLHHIIEYRHSNHTVEEESCILCISCHFYRVNRLPYQSEEYNELMERIERFRIQEE